MEKIDLKGSISSSEQESVLEETSNNSKIGFKLPVLSPYSLQLMVNKLVSTVVPKQGKKLTIVAALATLDLPTWKPRWMKKITFGQIARVWIDF